MIKLWQKTFILIGLLGFLSLLSTAPASAQNFKESHRESMEDSAFFKKFRMSGVDESAIALLSKNEKTKEIYCGDDNTLCNDEQVCLKCEVVTITMGLSSQFGGTGGSTSIRTTGRCISKNSLNNSNLNANWPNCEGTVTIENGGFGKKYETIYGQGGSFTISDKKTFSDGKHTYELILRNNEFQIAYSDGGKKGSAFSGCEVFPIKAYKMQGCFYCRIAKIVFDTADRVTADAFFYFANSFKILLVIIFGIWLVLMSANYAFSMTKQDAPKFLTSVLVMAFKIAIAFYLLTYSTDIFEFFIRPILEAGLAMGENIQTLSINIETEGLLGSGTSGYYGLDLRSKIERYLTFIQSQLAYMQALGSTIFCVGSHRLSFWNTLTSLLKGDWKEVWVPVIDAFRVMFLGGFLTIFGFLITIAFGYYFIDAVVQLIIIGMMVPFMIATWPLPFGQTKYASKGLEMLLNTFFIFFMTGFVVCVCINLIDNSLASAQDIQSLSSETAELHKETSEGFQAIIDALYDQNWETLNASTTLGVSGFLLLIFSSIFGFKFIGKATEISGTLSSGLFKNKGGLAGRVGTMAYSAAKGVAGKVASPFADGIADQYHAAGGIIGMGAGVTSWMAGQTTDKLGHKLTSKIGGAEDEGKKWSEKSTRGKIGAVVGGAFKAPGAAARFIRKGSKKLHGTYRHN